MTVSTVSGAAEPRPSARVLILKDLDRAGWHFAVSSVSRKGAELARNPGVALTFYWPTLGRQVRVEGIACQWTAETARGRTGELPVGGQ